MVFISYAREDLASAERIYSDLQTAGVDPWLDVHDLIPGQDWQSTIEAVIQSCSHILVLLSTNSVSKVGYIQKEIKLALEVLDRHPENSIFIVPVRLDQCAPSHSRLTKLHWVDMFPSWEGGITKIIEALKNIGPEKGKPNYKYGDMLFGLGNHVGMMGWVSITDENEVEMMNVFNRSLTIVEVLGLASETSKVISDFLQKKQAMDQRGDVTKSAERMTHIRNLLSLNIKSRFDVNSERIFSFGFILTNVIYMCERPEIVVHSKDYIADNLRHLRQEAVSLQLPHAVLDDALGILGTAKSRKERLLLYKTLVDSMRLFEDALR